MPAPTDPYLVVWEQLGWRRRGLRSLVAVVLFVFVAPALALAPFVDGSPAIIVALGLTLAMPATLFVLSHIPPFSCPRCEHPFFTSLAVELGSGGSCRACALAVGTPSERSPAPRRLAVRAPRPRPRAARWCGIAVVSAAAGYWLGGPSRGPSAFVAAVSAAAVVTTLAAAAMRSRAFPRPWLVPIAAFFFASLVGAGASRARRAQELQAYLRSAHCSTSADSRR